MSDPHSVPAAHDGGPARAPPSDPPLPATVGRYEVVRLLGEGAMGRVLLAHDPVLDRNVAVKHLRGDLKIPREVRRGLLDRMEHEARASARVAHPNLVVLHDMGEDPGVGLYLVFEYVEGPTLKQRSLGRPPAPRAGEARLARELGAALTTAHAAGILHRDVKPENVMLAKTGGKIADFGIARIPDSTLTHQGGLMGTPAYSAPETFRGGKFSPASDQFSLAASLYEALAGRRAFPGDDAVTVAARIASETPEPFAAAAGLPPAVDGVLARALDRPPRGSASPIMRRLRRRPLRRALFAAHRWRDRRDPRARSRRCRHAAYLAAERRGRPGDPRRPGRRGHRGAGGAHGALRSAEKRARGPGAGSCRGGGPGADGVGRACTWVRWCLSSAALRRGHGRSRARLQARRRSLRGLVAELDGDGGPDGGRRGAWGGAGDVGGAAEPARRGFGVAEARPAAPQSGARPALTPSVSGSTGRLKDGDGVLEVVGAGGKLVAAVALVRDQAIRASAPRGC